MADVQLSIKVANGVTVPAMPRKRADATYSREVTAENSTGAATTTIIQDAVQATLGEDATASLALPSVAPNTSIHVRFLSGTGTTRLERTIAVPEGTNEVSLELSESDVKTLGEPELSAEVPTGTVRRVGQLVPTNTTPVSFRPNEFRIAIIDPANWTTLGLDTVFNIPALQTTSVPVSPETVPHLAGLAWLPIHLGIGGGFDVLLPADSGKAWLWWFSDLSNVALGAVNDDLGQRRPDTTTLPLPPFAAPPQGGPAQGGPGRVPVDITESDLADNPDVFTEDPGAFCRPFSNPERILGERAFHVILRAEQPTLSSEPTRKFPTFPLFDFDPPILAEQPAPPVRGGGLRSIVDRIRAAAVRPASLASVPLSEAVDRGMTMVRPKLPAAYLDLLGKANRGRGEINADNPVDWEGDASRYQAATVVRGHILEYRLRWRSNGYSLGTVAKTLTLAPRQTRRIQKVEWERRERTRRQEQTQLRDQVVDEVARERTYEDTVEASLEEWARGESKSSTSSGAGGFGFAAGGFVIGGGGGHSRASSSSSTSGGRETRAAEEQRLRDTIRRFADSLRKLDSIVVTEVSQEETVTGTTEIVRNANYAHSLTVIYYQILRHLKLETAFASVRECVFVPFAVKPFTFARAYRWRESIRQGLRDRKYSTALNYLRDVTTGFAGSTVPPGRRADHQIRFIRGSITVSLGVERPATAIEAVFDEPSWRVLRPFLGVPALAIHTRLREVVASQRDRTFQQEQAPRIAAKWVDSLKLSASGVSLSADFTLASRYQFNGSTRVDFTVGVPAGQFVSRQMLSSIRVDATSPLTPGSVANVTSISYTYDTDDFRRSVSVPMGSNDLLIVDTGAVDPNGAQGFQSPDVWEQQDERAEMVKAVQELIGHLNEHVEHYHKAIWWAMDRDRMFMLADGAYIPGTNGVSVASVIERDPIAIIGNSLVFRVSAGAFLGIDGLNTPDKLYGWYADKQGRAEPMHVALPTDGLYAQTIMDECVALEEHYGDLDWVLNDKEPELGEIDPSLLMSRRAEPVATTPTAFPQTIISLQNAPEAPAPSGLAGALQAVQNAGAFRDMAGLAGTQANSAAGFQTAANLATSFGQQAAALKLAEMAAKSQATKEANQKLGTIKKAKEEQLVTPEKAAEQAGKVIEDLNAPSTMPASGGFASAITEMLKSASLTPGSEVTAAPDGVKVALGVADTAGKALASFGLIPPVASFFSGMDAFRDWIQKVETFKTEAVRVAREELANWAGRPESDAAVLPFLVAYGSAGGNANPAAWAASAAADNIAWSAGFISFVVQQAATAAGIPGDPFERSTLHSNYIRAAKQHRVNKNFANPFWLYRLDEVKPEAGDFLCKNRPGVDDLTFDNIPSGSTSHVDIVTNVTDAQLLATGGNRGNHTVVEAAVQRTDGFVTATSLNLAGGPYFAILRVRTTPFEGMTVA